jgi:transcription initiation factor IIE alpha subunit
MQYLTPFTCPKCGEHTFETGESIETAMDLAGSRCSNCGHVLTEKEILAELKTIPESTIEVMLENAAELNRPN